MTTRGMYACNRYSRKAKLMRASPLTTTSYLDVAAVLHEVPKFDAFCSVDRLNGLVETLRRDPAFEVRVVGTSERERPIHHVRFGSGPVKALFVGFPHPNEPIGGLTAFSLLTLLSRRAPTLLAAGDVEWHVVPCADPDGAILNEGWSQQPFSLENYMRNFHRQAARHQVDCSFPINYKRLQFDQPIKETRILMGLLDAIRPDFYYPLHNNAGAGGAWLLLSRGIDPRCYGELHQLLETYQIPLQVTAPFGGQLTQFADGVYQHPHTRMLYDRFEQAMPNPEEALQRGAMSFEYLSDIHGGAVSFVSELPYVRHSSAGSRRETACNMRLLKLRVDADNKFLATVILEEWDKVQADLDSSSAFHRKTLASLINVRDRLHEGPPSWPAKTRDLLFNPRYARGATEGERFDVYLLDRFFVLCHSYEFVRLLRGSPQTPGVRGAVERLEEIFTEALAELTREVDFQKFEVIEHRVLAQVQLGAGLIVLNSVRAAHS